MERYRIPNLAQRCLVIALCLGPSLPLLANTAADQQYALAAAHYAQGEWQLASEAFHRFRTDHSRDDRASAALYYHGECLIQAERYPEALALLEGFLEAHPRHPQAVRARFRAGEVAYRLGLGEKATRYLAAFREENSGHELEAFATPHLAAMALDRGDAEESAELYASALRTFPRGPLAAECRLGLATAQEILGNLAEAERFYRVAALAQDTLVAHQARLRLARLLVGRKDYHAALELLVSLTEEVEDPRLVPHVALWKGRALAGTGERHEAAAAWWSAAERFPDSELAEQLAHQAAVAFRQLGEPTAAKRAYGWLIQRDPASPWHEECLVAQLHLQLDATDPDEEEILDTWQQLVRTFPESPHRPALLQRLGHHLLRKQRYATLLALLDELTCTIPSATSSPITPECYLENEARRSFEPPLAAYLYGLAYWSQGQHEAAWQQLRDWNDDQVPNELRSGFQQLRASCLFALRRFEEVIPLLQRELDAASSDAEKPHRHLRLALALLEVGRLEEAEQTLELVWHAITSPRETINRNGEDVDFSQQSHGLDGGVNSPSNAMDSPEIAFKLGFPDSSATDEAPSENSPRDKNPPGERVCQVASELAEKAYAARNYSLAARQFGRVARHSRRADVSITAHLGETWSLFHLDQLRDAELALDRLNTLLDSNGQAPALTSTHLEEARYLRGRVFERQARVDEAIMAYRSVSEADVTSRFAADAWFAAGRLQDRRGRNQEAFELLGQLLATFPEYSRADAARYMRAWSLVELGDEDAADAVFAQIMTLHPESEYWPDAVYRLAERAARGEAKSRAAELIEKLLDNAPLSELAPQGLYLRGQLAAEDRRWRELQQDMQRIVVAYPESSLRTSAEYWLAEANYQQGRYPLAAEQFRQLASETEAQDDAWMAMIPLRLAQSLAHVGEWTDAKRFASSIAGRFPNFSQQHEADYVIGRALVHDARLGQAREAFERVTNSPTGRGSETAAMAHWMIGETYFHQRNYRAASQAYLATETLYNYPRWRAAARLQLGKCYEAQQKWDAAIRYYKLVIDGREDSQLATEAERRYSELQQRETNPRSAFRFLAPR